MISGFSAILLPQLEDPNSEIPITKTEGSWIASVAALPMALGCIVGGYIMEKHGRKLAHSIPCLPLVLGWCLIFFARGLYMLLVGRFLTGLASGILAPPTAVYIGETSSPQHRGFLLASISLAMSLGLLITHVLGTYFTWKVTTIICIFLPCIAFLILIWLPESPSWLARRGCADEAIAAFLWCRGHSTEAKEEMIAMMEREKDAKEETTKISSLAEMKKPEFLKPLAIINVYLLIPQFCGVNAISFYSVSIMHDTMGDIVDKYAATIIIDSIRLISSVTSCILLSRIGRRSLTISSGIGTAISLFLLSSFIYLKSYQPSLAEYSFIALVPLTGYIGAVTVGLVPIPWAMVGEVFPLHLRGFGSGISSTIALLAIFAVVKATPSLFDTLGSSGAFLLFGCVACLGTVFLWWFLPETKDKTLQEIEESWKGKDGGVKEVKEMDVVVC